MDNTWQLQTAKNRFSELVDRVLTTGPQTVTRHGKEVVVVVPAAAWHKQQRPRQSLVEFFRTSPLAGIDIPITRSRDAGRKVNW